MQMSLRAHFEAGCARGVLLYQWDPKAEHAVFYPRVLDGLEWRESKGKGTVYSATTIRPRGDEPHGVALIDLDEGFRMMSRVRADEVRIGMRVLVAFEEGVPVFDPLPGSAGPGGGTTADAGAGGHRPSTQRTPPLRSSAGDLRLGLRRRPIHRSMADPGIAIAGVAESDLGAVPPGTRPEDLMAQAATRALDECGLELADVDGLFAAATQLNMPTLSAGEYLGIRPRYSDATQMGGSSFIAHLQHAAAAIGAGLCEVALILYGSTQRLVGRAGASVQELDPYEAPYEPANPMTAYALAAARHMHEFGTTPEQLAEVAVSARRWAQLNPKAWSRDELTIADVLAAPRVCDPLGVRDCCLVTDGGAAAVVVSAERARDLRTRPVELLSAAEAHHHRHISQMPDIVRTAAADSGARAFAAAGLTPADVDVLMLYDAFTITPILFLEDLGFCAKGEGGALVEGGRTAPGGTVPMNTNGGGLSYCHPGMYGLFLIVEAVRQLRGECGERQVAGADVALVHGNGGVLSSQCTALLGRG